MGAGTSLVRVSWLGKGELTYRRWFETTLHATVPCVITRIVFVISCICSLYYSILEKTYVVVNVTGRLLWITAYPEYILNRFVCVPSAGNFLRLGLESDSGSASHGQGSQTGPNQTGHSVPPCMQSHHRGAHPTAGQGKE